MIEALQPNKIKPKGARAISFDLPSPEVVRRESAIKIAQLDAYRQKRLSRLRGMIGKSESVIASATARILVCVTANEKRIAAARSKIESALDEIQKLEAL